ncbi:MAG: hypothetical protein ABI818_20920, partial [Acidobacteriota bacterium]
MGNDWRDPHDPAGCGAGGREPGQETEIHSLHALAIFLPLFLREEAIPMESRRSPYPAPTGTSFFDAFQSCRLMKSGASRRI